MPIIALKRPVGCSASENHRRWNSPFFTLFPSSRWETGFFKRYEESRGMMPLWRWRIRVGPVVVAKIWWRTTYEAVYGPTNGKDAQ